MIKRKSTLDSVIVAHVEHDDNSPSLPSSSSSLSDLPPELISCIFSFIPRMQIFLFDDEQCRHQTSEVSSIMLSSHLFRSLMQQEWDEQVIHVQSSSQQEEEEELNSSSLSFNASRTRLKRHEFVQIKRDNYEFSKLEREFKAYEDYYGLILFDKKSLIVPIMRVLNIVLCCSALYDFKWGIRWMYAPFLIHIILFTVFSLVGYWKYTRQFTLFPTRLSLNHLASSQIMYLSLISFTLSYVTLFYGGIYYRLFAIHTNINNMNSNTNMNTNINIYTNMERVNFSNYQHLYFKYEIHVGLMIGISIGITLLDVCLIAIRKYSKTRNFLLILIVILPLILFYTCTLIGEAIALSYGILSTLCLVATIALAYLEVQKKEKLLSISCILSFMCVIYYLIWNTNNEDSNYFEEVIVISQLLFKLFVGYYGKSSEKECYCEHCKYKVVHL